MTKSFLQHILCAALALLFSTAALGEWQLGVEAGVFKPEYNKVQIPNDSRGDRFRITELGNGSFPAARLTLGWRLSETHGLQLVYAPFA